MTEPTVADEQIARWAIAAWETLRKCRDLLAQLAPAAPLLDEIDLLVTAAEEPWPDEEPPAEGDEEGAAAVGHAADSGSAPALGEPERAAAPEGEATAGGDAASPDYDLRCVLCQRVVFHLKHVYPAEVPEHQQDELFEAGTVTEHKQTVVEQPEPEGGELAGPVDAVRSLALMLVLCRMLLENNGFAASGRFVNEALAVVESLWPKVPAETKALAEEHAQGWEELAGW